MKIAALLAIVTVVSATGCSYVVNRAIDRTVDRTVDRAASRVGDRMGDAIAADILARNPHLLNAYAMGVFNVMFYQGGFYLDAGDYRVGEWSAWRSEGTAEADRYEKVLLRRHDSGNEWWRIETVSTSGDTEQTVVMEALFSDADATTGARRVLRMRAKLPGDAEPREIPITEQDRSTWQISKTNKLTKESLDGMTVGEENVDTPAGTFLATRLQYKGGDTYVHDWWLNDAVPGQLVKFRQAHPGAEAKVVYEVTLIEFGSDRTESKLGVDLDKQLVEAPPEDAAE